MEPSCHVPSLRFVVVLFGFLFGCLACFCVLVGCFVLELALLRSDLCSTFEPPKRDIVNAFANSFNQHNKVRRPGESHRGAGRKKKVNAFTDQMCERSPQLALAVVCFVAFNSFLCLHVFALLAVAKGHCTERHQVWVFLFGPGPVFLLFCLI